MTNEQALDLHNGDEVRVIATGEITIVLSSYQNDDGTVSIETIYAGYTIFAPDEIS